MTAFVDRVVLHMQAGNGGHGCVSILREKFKPFGGPDGGSGGHGGNVLLVVDPAVHTLLDFHFRPRLRATNGTGGAGGNRQGANGADLVVKVPDGTVVQTRTARCWPTWSAPVRRSRRPGAVGAAVATRHWRTPAAGRPASPSWASRVKRSMSCSSSRALPTSASSASRRPANLP